ncbi:MAG: iron ABC transporter permease [Bacteroidota bacterium]
MEKIMQSQAFLILSLAILLCLCLVWALFQGAFNLGFAEVVQVLLGQGEPTQNYLIFQIRLPRIVLSIIAGAGLAISGAAIQGLFRNPLADQTLIGVTAGASLFAVIAIVLMGSYLAVWAEILKQATVSFFAFVGGFATTYLVYFLSKDRGRTNVLTMLLAGIAIAAFGGAITGVFVYLSDDQQLRDITFWTMGSFSGANWVHVAIAAPIVVIGTLLLLQFAKPLNAILLGEKEAQYLGINVERVKSRTILLTALMVGVCISMTGLIGFVGLVVPHFLRLLKGPDYRFLLPASALVGAIFLIGADTLSRTIIAPAELPIGILTASVGAPFFLWLLLKRQKEGRWS